MFGWVVKGTKKAGRAVARGADLPMLTRLFDFMKHIFISVFIREPVEVETFEERLPAYN